MSQPVVCGRCLDLFGISMDFICFWKFLGFSVSVFPGFRSCRGPTFRESARGLKPKELPGAQFKVNLDENGNCKTFKSNQYLQYAIIFYTAFMTLWQNLVSRPDMQYDVSPIVIRSKFHTRGFCLGEHMGMDQYLLIPCLGGWTSIYQLFWCAPGVQGFDTLPYWNSGTFVLHHLEAETHIRS